MKTMGQGFINPAVPPNLTIYVRFFPVQTIQAALLTGTVPVDYYSCTYTRTFGRPHKSIHLTYHDHDPTIRGSLCVTQQGYSSYSTV